MLICSLVKERFSTYKTYRQSSHNIMYMDKWERYREKILHKGAMDIAVELSKLPPTKHLMDTFMVDVQMATVRFSELLSLDMIAFGVCFKVIHCSYFHIFFKDKIICFAVQGFFCDGVQTVSEDVKYFVRNFVVKVKGEGYALLEFCL